LGATKGGREKVWEKSVRSKGEDARKFGSSKRGVRREGGERRAEE